MVSRGILGRIRSLTLSGLLAGLLPSVAMAQGQAIDGGAYWIWTDIDQGGCLNRAVTALQAAAGAFQIPAAPQNPAGWYVALVGTGDLHAGVHCIPDDETTNLIGPSARRVLVVTTFSSTRGGVTSGAFLEFVDKCMKTGTCPSGSIAGNWSHPGGWGDIVIWEEAGRFVGTYSAKCDGATQQGMFNLERRTTPEGERYAGTWGEDVCRGDITSLYVDERGEARVSNTWLEYRGNASFVAHTPPASIWRRPQ